MVIYDAVVIRQDGDKLELEHWNMEQEMLRWTAPVACVNEKRLSKPTVLQMLEGAMPCGRTRSLVQSLQSNRRGELFNALNQTNTHMQFQV